MGTFDSLMIQGLRDVFLLVFIGIWWGCPMAGAWPLMVFPAGKITTTTTTTTTTSPAAKTSFRCLARGPCGPSESSRTGVILYDATGGWGIGQSRDMVPEEFARGDRRAFAGYELQDQGAFYRRVQQERESLRQGELAELLGVAQLAGLTVKDPSTRLNQFEPDLLADADLNDDDLDVRVTWETTTTSASSSSSSLSTSSTTFTATASSITVDDDDDDDDEAAASATTTTEESSRAEDPPLAPSPRWPLRGKRVRRRRVTEDVVADISITRLDEDTGSPGVW